MPPRRLWTALAAALFTAVFGLPATAQKVGESARRPSSPSTRRSLPNYRGALNSRAWLFATCPDPKFRNSKAAVRNDLLTCGLEFERVEIEANDLAEMLQATV